jgi:hypothetical protein
MVRPVALEIAVGDFALAAGHRLTAISVVAGTLNSAAPFSVASRLLIFAIILSCSLSASIGPANPAPART